MDFQRTGDVKETLRIGRKARAFKIARMEVKAEAVVPFFKDALTPKMMTKYNLTGESDKLLMGFPYIFSDQDMITALTILNQDGICRRFDDFVHEKVMMFIPEQVKKYPEISFDLKSEKIYAKIKWVLLGKETEPHHFAKIQLTFKLAGMDILFRDQLYRIAPPKDGGLDEKEDYNLKNLSSLTLNE